MDANSILAQFQNPILLKEGGQKKVYRATDPVEGQIILKIGSAENAQSLERIRREVEILREIDSPYYPKNIDFRVFPGASFLIVEEYLNAQPLTALLNKFVEPSAAVALVSNLVTGLEVLWCRRIVHRDVKPDNILISADGLPKIIDLGIARLLDDESLTRTLAPRGPCTPVYAAPEQLLNRKDAIDHRTDQFSTGILFLQLLLGGAHPFDPDLVGRGQSIVDNILDDCWFRGTLDQEPLDRFRRVLTRMLGKEPYMRFRNAVLLRNELAAC